MATATTEPVRLPPGPRIPRIVQAIVIMTASQHRWVPALGRRYGGMYTSNLPYFGKTVFISDPTLIKDIWSTSDDLLERPTNLLGPVFGPGSTFSLTGKEHLNRRTGRW
jgi:cytochrome P450